jgi:hypothetical protein
MTFTPEIILKIVNHIDYDIAKDLEMDDMELESIVETINEDSELQDLIADLS